jgi:CDP-diacylglycerol--glycerol-3-phosphate 3-phosphatidyltransferase
MNLPNALTLSRLAAIPLLMVLLIVRFDFHDQIAAVLFLAFSFTDTLDGQIARRRGTVSDLGKFLDPLADKLFVLSVLIVLVQEGLVAAWVVVVIFSRELLITILRSVAASQGRVIAAAPMGKTKTATQMAAVTLLILQRPYPLLVPLADLAVSIAILFTIASGVDYLWRFRHVIWPSASGAAAMGSAPSGGAPGAESPVDPLSRDLSALLIRGGLTVSVAESCTAGLLGALITDQPGSSAYFLGGVIAYADEVKREQLGVPAALLARHGAVSREVAVAMAEGVRSRLGTALAASITGIAGPDAEGGKPVGLTYIAVATSQGTTCHEYMFSGDRWSNRRQAAGQALRLLIEAARVDAGKLAS